MINQNKWDEATKKVDDFLNKVDKEAEDISKKLGLNKIKSEVFRLKVKLQQIRIQLILEEMKK